MARTPVNNLCLQLTGSAGLEARVAWHDLPLAGSRPADQASAPLRSCARQIHTKSGEAARSLARCVRERDLETEMATAMAMALALAMATAV